MDSGIVRTSSISSRNRDRAAARREVQEELNLAHMRGVMKSVRHTAREQGSGKSRVVLEEHTPSGSASNSSKPLLRVETEFHKVSPDYYKLGPSITEKKHGHVSTPVRGEDADRRQNAEERRHSQRSKISHSEDINLFKAIEEQTKETPALRRQKPTLQLRADFATTPEYPPMDPQAPKNKHLGLSPVSKGDTDRHQTAQSRRHSQRIKKSQAKVTNFSPAVEERSKSPVSKGDVDRRQTAQPRSYSQRIKESQPKDTNFSPAVKEQSKELPAPTRQKLTLQIRTDSASAEYLAQPDYRQTNPYAPQNQQRRVSAPIVKEDIDQCQIMEIISLYEEVREEKKEEGFPPPVPPKSERRGREQSRRVASGHSGTDAAGIPATDKQAGTTSAPKRQKPTLRIRTDLDSAGHLDYSAPETWASQQILDYLQMSPLALENEHQGASSPADKESTDRCQDYKQDRSGQTSQRPRLVDIVRQGLAESEAGSPTLNPSRSASLYGDYSCIYEEYSD